MKQRPRIYYSDAQKEFMWDRWQKGDSMRTIAGLFDRGYACMDVALGLAWCVHGNCSKLRDDVVVVW